MNIDLDTFEQIVRRGACHAAKLHAFERVHKITVQQYCQKLTVRSACTQDCFACAKQVLQAVGEVAISTDVRSRYGLFTWKLKDALARRMDVALEQKAKTVQRAVGAFGETVEADGLDLILETLNG